MAKLERKYIIPLRKEWLKSPKYKRSKKAAATIKRFLEKHMKSNNVKIGKQLNESVWAHGIKNPPHKVSVNVTKEEDGTVLAELEGFKYEIKKKVEKKKTEGGIVGKLKETLGAKEEKEEKIEEKRKEKVEEKAEKAKETLKEEIKEMEKEHIKAPKEAKKYEAPGHEPDVAPKAPRSDQTRRESR